jgi:putative superfamily III holin-X
VIAGALAFMTTFLLTALLVALFTLLFGRLWAGILATLILFLAVAVAAGALGWKALSKVRPFDFPVTGSELRKDWEALQRSAEAGEETAGSFAPGGGGPARPAPVDDFEARFRAGSE